MFPFVLLHMRGHYCGLWFAPAAAVVKQLTIVLHFFPPLQKRVDFLNGFGVLEFDKLCARLFPRNNIAFCPPVVNRLRGYFVQLGNFFGA